VCSSTDLRSARIVPALALLALGALAGCGTVGKDVRVAAVAGADVVAPRGAATPPALLPSPDPEQGRAARRQAASEWFLARIESPSGGASAARTDAPVLLAGQAGTIEDDEYDEYDIEAYDPWESFNEAMFEFNRRLDRHVLKPVATVYDRIVHDDLQRMVSNAFDNLGAIKRMVNSLLQAKWDGAARELSRFMLNSTVGIGGLFDIAQAAEIAKSREDFGQTLGVYGAGPGPYLVLPLLEPMTVRDGFGRAVDSFLDPLTLFIAPGIVTRITLNVTEVVNERSLNLELFEGFEETVIDLYSAVRHAYLERRRNLIRE
jgi:phospholipid-binding lipoprotein MlaA